VFRILRAAALFRFQGNRTTHVPFGTRGAPHVNNLMFLIFHPPIDKTNRLLRVVASDRSLENLKGARQPQGCGARLLYNCSWSSRGSLHRRRGDPTPQACPDANREVVPDYKRACGVIIRENPFQSPLTKGSRN
jgi:hypothetical protein